jgi:hypothetical protein
MITASSLGISIPLVSTNIHVGRGENNGGSQQWNVQDIILVLF